MLTPSESLAVNRALSIRYTSTLRGGARDVRKYYRWSVSRTVTVSKLGSPNEPMTATLVDVSRHGMRLRGDFDLHSQDCISVQIGDELLLGEVIWRSGCEVGVCIEQILDLSDLEKLISFDF
jgi:hypothetical protein